jgi:hypothetical protein
MLANVIEAVSRTGYFLILRDLRFLSPAILTDLASTILPSLSSRISMSESMGLVATYGTDNPADVPPQVRLMFHPVVMDCPVTNDNLKADLTGTRPGDSCRFVFQLHTPAPEGLDRDVVSAP